MHPHFLILDFDGVLHPVSETDSRNAFRLRHHLIALLERLPALQIVVSSSWRLECTLDEMKRLVFGDPGHSLAGRMTDTLPSFPDFPKPDELPFRLREAMAWGEANRVAAWIALDDKLSIWFRAEKDRAAHAAAGRHLVLCDGEIGMTPETVTQIEQLCAGIPGGVFR